MTADVARDTHDPRGVGYETRTLVLERHKISCLFVQCALSRRSALETSCVEKNLTTTQTRFNPVDINRDARQLANMKVTYLQYKWS